MDNHYKGFYQYCKGKKLKDIAYDLHVPESTVKTWMSRYHWKDKKTACMDEGGTINLEKARGFCKGKGNLEPVTSIRTDELSKKSLNDVLAESPHDDDFKMFVQQTLTNSVRNLGVSQACSDQECKVRIEEYFSVCIVNGYIPTVEGLWLALGIGRTAFYDWCNGKRGTVRAELLKNAKLCIHEFDTQLAMVGKMDKVLYMFIAKNWFGMRDNSDMTIHHDTSDPLLNKEEIQRNIFDSLPDDG